MGPVAGALCLTDRGNAANEDFVRATESYGIVVDGASGLAGEPLFAPRFATNAQWLSHVVGERACAELEGGASVDDALERAVGAARAELEAAAGVSLERMDPLAVPSATLALAAVTGDVVELRGLGDSPLAALMRDGSLVVVTDEALEALDARAVGLMALRDPGCALSGPERRRLVDDVVRANRLLRNVDGGYWSLDPSGDGLAHARRASLPREEVLAVAGMSDGMWRAFSEFGVAEAARELVGLTLGRAREIVRRLRELEASDSDLVRFPRLKCSDDASLFWIGL